MATDTTENNWRMNVCPACKTHHPNGWACPKDLAVVREDNARLRTEIQKLKDQDTVARALAGPLIEDLRVENAQLRNEKQQLAEMLVSTGQENERLIKLVEGKCSQPVLKLVELKVARILAEKKPVDAAS